MEVLIVHLYQGSAEEKVPEEEKVLPVTDEEEVLAFTDEEEKVLSAAEEPTPSLETPLPIEPGSDEWIYVDEPLPQVHYFPIDNLKYRNIYFS